MTGDDIQEGMYIVFNITAPNVSYDAQVKSRITKLDTKPFIQAVTDNLQVWLNSNEKNYDCGKALAAKQEKQLKKLAIMQEKNKKKEKSIKV